MSEPWRTRNDEKKYIRYETSNLYLLRTIIYNLTTATENNTSTKFNKEIMAGQL